MTVRGEDIETLSYARLAQLAGRLAAGLVAAGVAAGEPVGLFAPNLPEWIAVRLAIGAAGAVGVAFDDLSTASEAAALIRDSGCRRLFTTRAHAHALRQAGLASGIDIHLLDAGSVQGGGAAGWRALLADSPAVLPAVGADAPASLVYTSGTTGPPKSFFLSHANFAANLEPLLAENLLMPEDRVLLPLPLHHVYPFLMGLLLPLASGATIVLIDAATGPKIVRALAAARVTSIIGVPRLYDALVRGLTGRIAARGRMAMLAFEALLGLSIWLRRAFGIRIGRRLFGGLHRQVGPWLRRLVSGGARLEPDLAWRLEGLGWEVFGGYGLAETASVFTGNLPGRQRLDSDGRPLGGNLRIADPDAEGVGEIQLKGPSVFSGYRNDPQANQAAFTADGWFRTGDLGRLDEDGYLHFAARAKEMIVLGGAKNVSPDELEKFYGAGAYVQEIAVLERKGTLVALVLPDFAALQAGAIKRVDDALRVELTALGTRLPSYQRLSGFAIVRAPLPRTRLGKYQRFLLPRIYEDASKGIPAEPPPLSEADKALLASSPAREVWDYLRARFGPGRVRLDANPQLDLGIDSLEWITITLELQARLGIALDEEDIAGIVTIRDLLRVAAAAAPAPAAGPAGPKLAPDQLRWLEPPGAGSRALGVALYGVNRLLMRVFFRLRAEGLQHLPPRGPYLIVANHASDLDPLALAASLPLAAMRSVHWGGEITRLFSSALARALCRAANVFPVDERAPASSLALAAAVLEQGGVLIWFPEAWRSPTGELQRFLPGIGKLVAESKAPVVPALIRGTFEALPRGRHFPRPAPVRVRFGNAIDPAELGVAEGKTPDYARIAESLRAAVARLAEPGARAERR